MKTKNKKNNSTKQNRNNGFTLFELLVSISIIAVLTAVSVVSFGGLNKKTRDARRLSDLEKIRVALESAKQIGSTYPSTIASLVTAGYLDKIPTDPKTNLPYVFSRPTTSTYYICATVELSSSATSDTDGCGSSGYFNKVVQP